MHCREPRRRRLPSPQVLLESVERVRVMPLHRVPVLPGYLARNDVDLEVWCGVAGKPVRRTLDPLNARLEIFQRVPAHTLDDLQLPWEDHRKDRRCHLAGIPRQDADVEAAQIDDLLKEGKGAFGSGNRAMVINANGLFFSKSSTRARREQQKDTATAAFQPPGREPHRNDHKHTGESEFSSNPSHSFATPCSTPRSESSRNDSRVLCSS